MVNEATLIEGQTYINATNRSIPTGTTVEKGALLILNDNNVVSGTASAPVASNNIFGGIAAAERASTDSNATISAHMGGVHDVRVSGIAVSVGMPLKLASGSNVMEKASSADIGLGRLAGWAEEAVAANVPETIRVRLRG